MTETAARESASPEYVAESTVDNTAESFGVPYKAEKITTLFLAAPQNRALDLAHDPKGSPVEGIQAPEHTNFALADFGLDRDGVEFVNSANAAAKQDIDMPNAPALQPTNSLIKMRLGGPLALDDLADQKPYGLGDKSIIQHLMSDSTSRQSQVVPEAPSDHAPSASTPVDPPVAGNSPSQKAKVREIEVREREFKQLKTDHEFKMRTGVVDMQSKDPHLKEVGDVEVQIQQLKDEIKCVSSEPETEGQDDATVSGTESAPSAPRYEVSSDGEEVALVPKKRGRKRKIDGNRI